MNTRSEHIYTLKWQSKTVYKLLFNLLLCMQKFSRKNFPGSTWNFSSGGNFWSQFLVRKFNVTLFWSGTGIINITWEYKAIIKSSQQATNILLLFIKMSSRCLVVWISSILRRFLSWSFLTFIIPCLKSKVNSWRETDKFRPYQKFDRMHGVAALLDINFCFILLNIKNECD